MKKYFAILIILLSSTQLNAQSRGVKIGYIDMEYIFKMFLTIWKQKVNWKQKAQKWKQEIEAKKNEIAKLKRVFKNRKSFINKRIN
jgi:Skp family chaperone for outer membrane proteins